MSGAPSTSSEATAVLDEGLRCPRCGYNLTGLTATRCPECGVAFDWAAVRAVAANRPVIAFERASGRRKALGFLQTWLTALFVPWWFAQQAIRRVDPRHALAFLGVCLASDLLCFVFDADFPTWAAWMTTAMLYILAQTLLLTGFEALLRGPRVESLRFWFCASCYTSAVMATEWYLGPPLASFVEFVSALRDALAGVNPLLPLFDVIDNSPVVVHWTQVGLWLLGVTCCLAARLRTRLASRLLRALVLTMFVPLSFALYALFVEMIGVTLWDWYGGSVF